MVLFSCACRFFLGPIGWLGWILVGGCGKPQAVREDAAVVASSSVVNELDAALPAPVSLPPYNLELLLSGGRHGATIPRSMSSLPG